jgi:hypothetical protein
MMHSTRHSRHWMADEEQPEEDDEEAVDLKVEERGSEEEASGMVVLA